MEIMEIYSLIKDIKHPNARHKIIKEHLSTDIEESLGTNILKEIDYCIMNNLSHVPLAPCMKKCKYHNGKFLKVCNDYKLGDNNSCTVCHEHKTKTTVDKIKKTSIQKYGTEYPNQNSKIKDKIKSSSNYSDEKKQIISTKRKNTMQKIYGTDYAMHSEELKAKQMKSILNRRVEINETKKIKHMIKKMNMVSDRIPESIKIIDLKRNNTEYSTFLCTICNNQFKAKTYNKCSSIKCLRCNPNYTHVSTTEKEILNYIQSIYDGNVLSNTRQIIPPLELDIYIPELKLAIEYNGSYYHSTEFKDKSYHQFKQQQCSMKGIKLISIFDYMWESNSELLKNKLKYELVKSKKIFARKCNILEIDSKTYTTFCENNHLQGSANAKIKIGLFFDDKLLSVMSFSKPRFNKNYEYELIRYCSICTVVGGASKMLKYFEKMYQPQSLISYANLCWSNGKLYEILGFELNSISEPSYIYFKNTNDIINRYSAQKHKISNNYNSHLTEVQIMEHDGYKKIYDCGNAVYIKEYKYV